MILNRQEINVSLKKTQERLKYLEEKSQTDKKDWQIQYAKFETTITEMEMQRNESVKNERILKERLNLLKQEFDQQSSKQKVNSSEAQHDLLT